MCDFISGVFLSSSVKVAVSRPKEETLEQEVKIRCEYRP